MPSLIDLMLEGRKIQQHSPWPRVVVDAHLWKFAAGALAQGRWGLLGLWGEPTTVHMPSSTGTRQKSRSSAWIAPIACIRRSASTTRRRFDWSAR